MLGFFVFLALQVPAEGPVLLKPDRVFDGEQAEPHEGWVVLVREGMIEAAGPPDEVETPEEAQTIDLPGCTLLPGLMDAHTHVLLHPYNETRWNDQVLLEPYALRVARATNHLRAILDSGFTTIRDLGTEGAGYADVGLKLAVEQGIIPGPRMVVTTRAIAASGMYAPSGFAPEVDVPQGVEEADGDRLRIVVRDQVRRGADWIKVYADRWDPETGGSPTFSVEELKLIVETAASSGRLVAAHATTVEGMLRATEAGVSTIEHGDQGTPEVFRRMNAHKIAYCPTLAAAEAYAIYDGWTPGEPEPESLQTKRASFKAALETGVEILNGSDLGVFAHGTGARELELMVDYGMKPADVLRAATSLPARHLKLDKLGLVRNGYQADLMAVQGNPIEDIGTMRQVRFVMKGGQIVRDEPK